MQTSVTFTANSQTGNIPRISSAVKRLGYQTTDIKLERMQERSLDLITMVVKAQRQLLSEDFAKVVSTLDNVVQVDVSHQRSSQSALKTLAQSVSGGAAAKAAAPPQTDDIATFVKNEGRRLAGIYPDIRQPLIELEASMDPALRPILMEKIGYALGQWQYKKNFEQSGRLNSTVQQSLSMQKSHFNGMPVIQDLLSKGPTANLENLSKDPLQQIESVLADFLDVSMDGDTIKVENCPHCSAERSATDPDCNFVKEFIQGFMLNNGAMKGKVVEQLESQATGADACIFEIV